MPGVQDPSLKAEIEKPVTLTYEELLIACQNIGWDLSCGRCASEFFTGTAPYPHDPECKTTRTW
jgi:hypothetical protein